MKAWSAAERGQQLIIAAILMPVLLGALGLVADLGMTYTRRQQAQNAADAAAKAGGIQLCTSESAATAAAQDFAERNGYNSSKTAVTVLPGDAKFSKYVKVQISDTYRPVFASLVWNGMFPVRATAKAACQTGATGASILVLDLAAYRSLEMNGSGTIMVTNGNIHVNSNDSQAFYMGGSGTLNTLTKVTIVGNYRKVGSGTIQPGMPLTKQAVIDDPLKDLPAPTGTGCPIYSDKKKITGSGTTHVQPGIYEAGIDISGSGPVIFDTGSGPCEGMYILRGMGMDVSGSGPLEGNNVFFYIDDGASLDISGSQHVSFTAPEAGTYKGMVIFQAHGNGNLASVSGSQDINAGIDGLIYIPDAQLKLTGSGHLASDMIVGRLLLSGSGVLTLNGPGKAGASKFTWALVE